MSATAHEREAALAAGLRRRATVLERAGRSPLCIELMRGAADSAERGAIVATIFEGDPLLPGSVPALRLLGALHHLVLGDHAPQLAATRDRWLPRAARALERRAGVARPAIARQDARARLRGARSRPSTSRPRCRLPSVS